MFKKATSASVLLLFLSTLFYSVSSARQVTIRDGVYTESQAEAGQEVYERTCGACHNMNEYRDVLRSKQDTSLLDFWFQILGDMPADNPGSLLDNEYTEVIAFILSEYGFPAGDVELDPNNGMDNITIVSP